MDIHITLNTHFIGTLPLSLMSQAVGLSYILTASLRQRNWGQSPMIETRHQIL